ncbi:MAG: DUF1697 domain-containing protein [Planctomycetes bacterium]|nr:DUF1697 domain-containing protein [Planctomycetota bacterium]
METFISLLRGINVSGQNKIRMPELKGLYESLNLGNVVPYIQSGNVIFDCAEQNPAPLARSIETEIERSFGTSVRVFLRDKNSFQKIIDSNPFLYQRNEDPEKLHVTFLSDSPSEQGLRNLPASGGDCFAKERLAMTLDSKACNDTTLRGDCIAAADGGESNFRIDSKRSWAGNADEFLVYDKEIYLFCPNGYGRTKLSNNYFERKLRVSATTRNWKTVNALYEIANQRRA